MTDQAIVLAPCSVTGLGRTGVNLPLASSEDPRWLLIEEGFDLVREHEVESIFTVANGYSGTRGSLEEGSRLSQPVTFAAEFYANDPTSELGPALVVLPDWPHLEVFVNGGRLSVESGRAIEHKRMLDLRQGVLWREWRQEDLSGRITRVRYEHNVSFVRDARTEGVRTAIVSSSENCGAVLDAAGLTQLFDVCVDGIDLRRLGLAGKPAPDMFLEAARRLKTPPSRAVVFEDAVVGVEAGCAGRFGHVVGIGRGDHAEDLRGHRADIVVADLGELSNEEQWARP